jgi:hypothetical protein
MIVSTADLFEIIGSYFVDIYYNHLYLKNPDQDYADKVADHVGKFATLYRGIIRHVHEYYCSATGESIGFTAFEDQLRGIAGNQPLPEVFGTFNAAFSVIAVKHLDEIADERTPETVRMLQDEASCLLANIVNGKHALSIELEKTRAVLYVEIKARVEWQQKTKSAVDLAKNLKGRLDNALKAPAKTVEVIKYVDLPAKTVEVIKYVDLPAKTVEVIKYVEVPAKPIVEECEEVKAVVDEVPPIILEEEEKEEPRPYRQRGRRVKQEQI